MKHIGVDFDNTIVIYDNLFYRLAVEQNLIKGDTKKSKESVRKSLIEQNQEDKFTIMQGEVYGSKIHEAEPAENVLKELKKIKDKGCQISIISHKTKHPYKGPKYDLHESAIEWLKKHKFFDQTFLNLRREDVYFEETKERKIERIKKLGCTHYIDDLYSIVEMLDGTQIKAIHYTNDAQSKANYRMKNWSDLESII